LGGHIIGQTIEGPDGRVSIAPVPVMSQSNKEFVTVFEMAVKAAFGHRHLIDQGIKVKFTHALPGHLIYGHIEPFLPAKNNRFWFIACHGQLFNTWYFY
jgi:hypothetical protein